MKSIQSTRELVQTQARLKGIGFQIDKQFSESLPQIGVLSKEAIGVPIEVL